MLETPWNVFHHRNSWLATVVVVNPVADSNVQEKNEGCSESTGEEEYLLLGGIALCEVRTGKANQIEHRQSGQTNGSIEIRSS